MRIVGYIRVSTDSQEDRGTSLKSQREAIETFCKERGWDIVRMISDTESGSHLNRPGMNQIREMMRNRQVDMVVAYAVDRLSRDQNHMGVLFSEASDYGVKFDTVTERFEDSPIGRFILAARSFMAETERAKITERTTRGKAERAKAGKIPHGTNIGCYGYVYIKETGTRIIHEEQAEVVRLVFRLSAEGMAAYSIAVELKNRGMTTLTGREWSPRTITNTLRNHSYRGVTYTGTRKREKVGDGKYRIVRRPEEEWVEIHGATPAIVDEGTWEAAQRRLDAGRLHPVNTNRRSFLLGGLIRCACGTPMSGHSVNYGKNPYYRCPHSYRNKLQEKTCRMTELPAKAVEAEVWRRVKRLLSNPELILAEMHQRQNGERDFTAEITVLRGKLKRLDDQGSRLVRLYRMGEFDDETIDRESGILKRQKLAVQDDLHNLLEQQRQVGESIGMTGAAAAFCERMIHATESFGWDEQRMALEALDIKVSILPTKELKLTGSIPTETFDVDWLGLDDNADVRTVVTNSSRKLFFEL